METVAWIAEDPDPDDHLMASGRFSAHVESDAGVGDEIEHVPVDEAIRWARERCEVVLIRLYDSDYHSAGSRNPDPGEHPPWTDRAVERRRPRGLEMLDNTEADPPVAWDVRFSAAFASRRRVLKAVLEDDRVEPIPADVRDEQASGAQVVIQASTRDQAHAIADAVLWERVHPLLRRRPWRRGITHSGFEVYPLSPESPVRFGAAR
jgi:hypothetical protein